MPRVHDSGQQIADHPPWKFPSVHQYSITIQYSTPYICHAGRHALAQRMPRQPVCCLSLSEEVVSVRLTSDTQQIIRQKVLLPMHTRVHLSSYIAFSHYSALTQSQSQSAVSSQVSHSHSRSQPAFRCVGVSKTFRNA